MKFVRYKGLTDKDIPRVESYLGTFVDPSLCSIGFIHAYRLNQETVGLWGKIKKGKYGFFIKEIQKKYPTVPNKTIEEIEGDEELTRLKEQVKEIEENSEEIK